MDSSNFNVNPPPLLGEIIQSFSTLTKICCSMGLKPPTKRMVEDDIFKLLEVLRLKFHLVSIPIFIFQTDAFH